MTIGKPESDKNLDINITKLTSVHELTVHERHEDKEHFHDIKHRDSLWMTLTVEPCDVNLQALWDFAVRLESESKLMGAKLKTKELISILMQSL